MSTTNKKADKSLKEELLKEPSLIKVEPSEKAEENEKAPEVAETPEAPAGKKTQVIPINMPSNLLMGSSRLAHKAYKVETKVIVDIPEGSVGLILLSPKLAELTRVRLVNPTVLIPEDSDEPLVLIFENLGIDPYMLKEGTEVARCVIL